jgi:hypothetical protein
MAELFDDLMVKTIKTNLVDNMLNMMINTEIYTEQFD